MTQISLPPPSPPHPLNFFFLIKNWLPPSPLPLSFFPISPPPVPESDGDNGRFGLINALYTDNLRR